MPVVDRLEVVAYRIERPAPLELRSGLDDVPSLLDELGECVSALPAADLQFDFVQRRQTQFGKR